jgi:hypothetical protein
MGALLSSQLGIEEEHGGASERSHTDIIESPSYLGLVAARSSPGYAYQPGLCPLHAAQRRLALALLGVHWLSEDATAGQSDCDLDQKPAEYLGQALVDDLLEQIGSFVQRAAVHMTWQWCQDTLEISADGRTLTFSHAENEYWQTGTARFEPPGVAAPAACVAGACRWPTRVCYSQTGDTGYLYLGLADGRTPQNLLETIELMRQNPDNGIVPMESRFCMLYSNGLNHFGMHNSNNGGSGWTPNSGFLIRDGDTIEIVYDATAGVVEFHLNDDADTARFTGFEELSPILVCSMGVRGESMQLIE